MSELKDSLHHIRILDDLARQESPIHRLHPLTKLMTTLAFLLALVSYGSLEVVGLLPFLIFPYLILSLSGLPSSPILKRVLLAGPIILGIGILNPVFDRQLVEVGGFAISRGWLTFGAILIKSGLTVTTGILLIATTGMDRLAQALRILKVPKIFVLQLLLTYRYISVLMEEFIRMVRAYSMRAPGQRGIQRNAWGSFAGQLLLRTFDRAQRVYEAMSLRGFAGEYHVGGSIGPSLRDVLFFFGWVLFFLIARFVNIPLLLGSIITGVTNL